MFELDDLLKKVGLRSDENSASTVFSKTVNLFRRLMNPRSAEVAVTVTPKGVPVVLPRIEFGGDEPHEVTQVDEIPHERTLGLLNKVLAEADLGAWLVIDRLDEAFQGFPAAEIPVLRALLRTYLDLNEFDRIGLKLFVRKDLFRRIIGGGFVNLTHVNARKLEIVWEEDDLYDLLIRRVRENAQFIADIGMTASSPADEVFGAVFPSQVDPGKRKPSTEVWIMGRIRDANGIKPPRNLIDLVQKAQEEQRRREQREKTEYAGQPIISSEALKQGLSRLSQERVEDTLIAEAGPHADSIEQFRDGKAEHNDDSLKELLDIGDGELPDAVRVLMEIGFLEKVGSNYKIPMLYRDGLNITQGKRSGDVSSAGPRTRACDGIHTRHPPPWQAGKGGLSDLLRSSVENEPEQGFCQSSSLVVSPLSVL